MKINEYLPKELPYKFVIFYNIPSDKKLAFHFLLSANPDDNAYVMYCYLDPSQGLSYKALCSAKINGETGEIIYNKNSCKTIDGTFREGALECDAVVLDNIEEYEEEAEFIKSNYGYYEKAISVDENIPFDAFRHPCYPKDILCVLANKDLEDGSKKELIWVKEITRGDGFITGRLINEPYNEAFGLKNGYIVIVKEGSLADKVWPMILV